AGSPGIAVGNIVGSNMANLLLILGTAAIIAPIAVARGVLWRDGGVGIVAAFALLGAGLTVGLDRVVGLAFLLAIAGYIWFAYRQERLGGPHGAAYDRAMAVEEADPGLVPHEAPSGRLPTAILLFAGGLALVFGGGTLLVDAAISIAGALGVADEVIGHALVFGGGTLLVDAAISIAGALGVADEVIGLTVVAVGTSLPEL